jgi:hypothetical protein
MTVSSQPASAAVWEASRNVRRSPDEPSVNVAALSAAS